MKLSSSKRALQMATTFGLTDQLAFAPLRQRARPAGGKDHLTELALRPHDEFGGLDIGLTITEAVRGLAHALVPGTDSTISQIVLASASARSET